MKRILLISVILATMLFSACGAAVTPIPTEPTHPLPQKEATEQKRMELIERLQQVNDAIAISMEQVFEMTDNINKLYGNISSLMQRDQQITSELNDRSLNEMMGPVPGWRSSKQSTIDNDQKAISSYNFKISEIKIKLRELQNRQLELEKERNQLLVELAK